MRRGTRKALPHSTPQRSEQRSQQQDVADFFVICAAIAHATATIASSTIARRGTRLDRQAGQSGFEMRRTCDEMCACILNSAFQVGNNCNLVWSCTGRVDSRCQQGAHLALDAHERVN